MKSEYYPWANGVGESLIRDNEGDNPISEAIPYLEDLWQDSTTKQILVNVRTDDQENQYVNGVYVFLDYAPYPLQVMYNLMQLAHKSNEWGPLTDYQWRTLREEGAHLPMNCMVACYFDWD